MSAIELEKVTKSFNAETPIHDFTLRVARGAFVLLLGPSGCGKTTLLRLIAGLEVPDSGVIALDGRPVSGPVYIAPVQRNIGMAFQDFALWPHKTVAGHLEFVLRARGVRRHERVRRIGEALDWAELTEYRRAYPATLSGGQQQRLSIARALVTRPAILLLDEPFANLDPRLRARVLEAVLAAQRQDESTVLLATHDPGERQAHADEIIRLPP